MSITHELRDAIATLEVKHTHNDHDFTDFYYPSPSRRELTAIADRIDAEHESKVSYWQGASYKDGYDEGFASADDWLAQHADAMAEHGWIRLPVDADGEYIRVGDVMDSNVDYLFDGRPFEVRALVLCEDEWEAADGRYGNRYKPNSLRHHHAPTVEDVLREFADAMSETHPMDVPARIAEYAAKLRLASDANA